MTSHESAINHAPKLLVTIVNRDNCNRLEDILREKQVLFHYLFNAMGTASSEILKAFGLSGAEKIVCLCIESTSKINALMTAVTERMELTKSGNGIVFVSSISGVSGTISNALLKQNEARAERQSDYMEREHEYQDTKYELVLAIVNHGYSEEVMDAARQAGARGGTIINARRSSVEEAVKFFGITLQAEKEIVAIVAHKSNKLQLMKTISSACGMKSEAQGIVLALPVESCAGLEMNDIS